MVNKRKVRLMARTAMYEKHEGKRELKNVIYYRSDYIGMHMLFAGIGITGGYLLTLMLICAYRFEYIVNNLTKMDYRGLGSTLIVSYVLLLIVAQVISYFIFSMRYSDCEDGMRVYINRLKKIDKLSREEKSDGEKEYNDDGTVKN